MLNFSADEIIERLLKIYSVKTMKELAEILEISAVAVTNWKKRNAVPSEILFRTSLEKGVSLDWLVYGKEVSKELDPLEQLALIAFNRLNNEEKINALTLMNMGSVKLGAIQDTPTNNTISQHATNNGRNHLSISK